MKYITPQWFSNLCPENSTGLSADDYREISQNPKRYLKAPIFRSAGTPCLAAMKMGMTREELIKMGMTKEEYWDIYLPYENGDTPPKHSDEEWAVAKAIYAYMGSKGKLLEFVDENTEFLKKYVKEWLAEYGVVPVNCIFDRIFYPIARED